jgi:single-stranded-DNA-specific exonuclease
MPRTFAGAARAVNRRPQALLAWRALTSFRPRPADPALAARLSEALGVHPVTAQILVGRGLGDPERARRFLRPDAGQLHDPALFLDMERATGILREAIRDGARIAVYGDYDVDGVCGTAVLVRTLGLFGADVRPFIPHRVADGYGLQRASLLRLEEEGCRVVVTVDNGTTKAEEVEEAQARGLAVVVTDHHEPGTRLPPCPLLNPKRKDATYPFPDLAGCGVAFKLALALAKAFGRLEEERFRALVPDLLALVAVGTVADVVPLLDENRVLVSSGLRALGATRHAGLRALLDVSRCDGREVRTTDVAFRIGPRLNAAGRLDSAHAALDLVLCEEPSRAKELALRLDAGNRERQRIEREQSDEALARAAREVGRRDAPALVLADAAWHPGVIGIVAARVAETFRRPVALVALEGGQGRGSARSFGGVRLHEALDRCADHLLTHGGHAFAAGFTMRAESVDAFRGAFEDAVRGQATAFPGAMDVDAELPLEAIHAPLAREIDLLRPFGAGNREPLFCAYGLRAAGRPRRAGSDSGHLVFYAATDRTSVRAVAFGQAGQEPLLDGRFDLAFVLRPAAEGPEPVEIHVREIRSCEPRAASSEPEGDRPPPRARSS